MPKTSLNPPQYPPDNISVETNTRGTAKKTLCWCHGAMSTRAVLSLVPWGYERSSALTSAHGTIAPYSWVLLGTHGNTWALLGAHECSWQVMSFQLFNQTINKKCKFLECSILTTSYSIFHQIIKNWIFLKSTPNGLLKNVQYGISRHIG